MLQKKSQENINSRLALVMKSGKFTLGSKTSIKCLRSGKGEAAARACMTYWGQRSWAGSAAAVAALPRHGDNGLPALFRVSRRLSWHVACC